MANTKISVINHIVKFIYSYIKTLKRGKVGVYSKALTILSYKVIIPLLVFVFAITGGLGFDSCVERLTSHLLTDVPEALDDVLSCAKELKETITSVMAAIFSIIWIFFPCYGLSNNVNNAFSSIWGSHISNEKKRSDLKKILVSISLVLLSPVIIIIMNTGIAFLTPIEKTIADMIGIHSVYHIINLGIMLTLITVVLTIMYKMIPLETVKIKNALISGIVASSIFLIIQEGYLHIQIGVFRMNTSYGILAAPLFYMGWIIVSWFIILAGGVLCFTLEHPDEYDIKESNFIYIKNYDHKLIRRSRRKNIFQIHYNIDNTPINQCIEHKVNRLPVAIHCNTRGNIKATSRKC